MKQKEGRNGKRDEYKDRIPVGYRGIKEKWEKLFLAYQENIKSVKKKKKKKDQPLFNQTVLP